MSTCQISFPDGAQRSYEGPVTPIAVAKSISRGLAKNVVAARVNDNMVDLNHAIQSDVSLQLITAGDPDGLDVIRHSSAHLLAQAVKCLFPEAQVTIGPVIEHGFYYDFAYERPFTPDDLRAIEKKMNQLARSAQVVERHCYTRDQAIDLFEKMGEHFKVEIIQDIPVDENLTVYQQGEFMDLCRGPHVPNTKMLKAFKLTHVAGSYWRGDSNKAVLQRIYGTAFATQEDLDAHLKRIEQAKERDHREIIKKMGLAHFQPEAPGMVFWHPSGQLLVRELCSYVLEVQKAYGYQEVSTPQMADVSLWEKSGHLSKFNDDMFLLEAESHTYALKPMNCPCHVQIFNQGLKSYRDLPVRLSEFGSCMRNEPSGTLHGLMRLRQFVQDDAHIFCTEDQIEAECIGFINQLNEIYTTFGFDDVEVRLATRPEKRVGDDALWDKAESLMEKILNDLNMTWVLSPGEGAFYGPKYEFSLKDCLGRVWQLGTLQLDFSMPGRLGASYVDESGQKQVPVMLHRAVLGSIERFIGVMLEHFSGRLPLWLAPKQAVVMNISDDQSRYAEKVVQKLQKMGIRAHLDLRNEKIGYKIREHSVQRVPFLIILGNQEVEKATISVRGPGGVQRSDIVLDEFATRMHQAIQERSLSLEGILAEKEQREG